MKSSKGFTITEALVSLAVLMVVSTAFLPLSSFISRERESLSQKREITYQLHDELQSNLYAGDIPNTFQKSIRHVDVTFTFSIDDNDLIQGCANWTNLMNRQEEVCLYGIQ